MAVFPKAKFTVGVFDSGFGGLTVLRELLPLIPDAHFLYLGDTARLPYGAKSQATVARYAVEAARFLAAQGAQLLVIACNTATALALEDIRQALPIPVVGVIEPVVEAAHARFPGSEVLVLATAATVQSGSYRQHCAGLRLRATEKACPLLVPLVEEGWTDHPVTREVLRIYLGEALAGIEPRAVLLGCTHYPLLSAQIESTLAELRSGAVVIDSARATALAVKAELALLGAPAGEATVDASFECFATDSVEKFARLGSLFLGRPMARVQLLDLDG